MILTQLEGRVSAEQWDTLKRVYHEGVQELPDYIKRTCLVQDKNDGEVWRILTFWQSWQALQDYRASVETPGGVLMFREAGAEPTLSIYEVAEHSPEA